MNLPRNPEDDASGGGRELFCTFVVASRKPNQRHNRCIGYGETEQLGRSPMDSQDHPQSNEPTTTSEPSYPKLSEVEKEALDGDPTDVDGSPDRTS